MTALVADNLRILLPLLLLAYAVLTMAFPVWRVRRSTGLNPVRTEDPNTPHGYVARLLAWVIAAVASVIGVYAADPAWETEMLPIAYLRLPALQAAGFGIATFALFWTALAQTQMGDSWRVGVDSQNRTDLVGRGLYRFSRNPIYLGLILAMIGLFFALPNALTFSALICGTVLTQVEVRLEEQHMRALHGEAFDRYCEEVRRWA